MSTRGRPRYPEMLTPRQQEVLALVREGLTNEEIAQRLGITLDGAKFHVSEILTRLGVSSRHEAAEVAFAPAPARRAWAFAPLALLGKLKWNAAAYAATAAGAAIVIAGIVLLAWGLARTDGTQPAIAVRPTAAANCAPALTCGATPPSRHDPGAIHSTNVTIGPTITPDAQLPQLPTTVDGDTQGPVAAWSDSIVLERVPVPTRSPDGSNSNRPPAQTFVLWNATTGETRPAWHTEAGINDYVGGVSGDWLADILSTYGTEPPDWRLVLRNLRTGETRDVAHSTLTLPKTLECTSCPTRGYGYPARASVGDGHVVWLDFTQTNGRIEKRMQMYDIASRKTTTVATIDPTAEDIENASYGAGKLAWTHGPASGAQEIVVLDVASGSRRTYQIGGQIFGAAISGDGRYVAWDDKGFAKYALDLQTGEVTQFASDEGSGLVASGHFASWFNPGEGGATPDEVGNGDAGYYDMATHRARFVSDANYAPEITSGVMGDWFWWQERRPSPTDATPGAIPPDIIYFVRLDQ